MFTVAPGSVVDLDAHSEELENFSLWWDDLEESGVEALYFAIEDESGAVLGFQSVNIDGRTIAIECREDFMGKGVASALVEFSGSWKPERNECPEFWEKMEAIYG